MVQSACCHHFLLRFESFSKMEGYEGYFTNWIWWSILTFFTILMDKSGWNWWPNWRVFDALTDSGKIFDWYGRRKNLFTLKAGEKSQILMSFRLFLFEKLGHFQTENWLKIHEQIKLLLKSYSVVQSACLYVAAYRFYRTSKIQGYGQMMIFHTPVSLKFCKNWMQQHLNMPIAPLISSWAAVWFAHEF